MRAAHPPDPRFLCDSAGNIVLVTGGGRGLGRLMSIDFAVNKNCIVVIWDKEGAGPYHLPPLGKGGHPL